jgi:hypothetical protein
VSIAPALRTAVRILLVTLMTLISWTAGPTPAGAAAPARIDHSPYDRLLKRYVDAEGAVNYRQWKANDRAALTAYLAALSAVDPARLPGRNDRLAFWINAYNALTIDAILDFYPIESIKDKVSHLFGYNVWDDYPLAVAGRAYSLNAIEHEVLRPMGEPRIHFAIVCASRSCPTLRREAYVAERLDAQLDDNTRGFFGAADRFRIDRAGKTVYFSPILNWFSDDFGGTNKKKMAFAQRFVDIDERNFLDTPGLSVRYLPYDWSLNEQP